jgi:hypothetical protein
MGLFDFALRPGQRFNKEELRVLDQNLNSISAYTKNKYRFSHRGISDDISGTHYGIDRHRVWYSHQDINNENNDVQIDCSKYFINTENLIDRTLDNPHLTDKCIKEIKTNTIKFLKDNY